MCIRDRLREVLCSVVRTAKSFLPGRSRSLQAARQYVHRFCILFQPHTKQERQQCKCLYPQATLAKQLPRYLKRKKKEKKWRKCRISVRVVCHWARSRSSVGRVQKKTEQSGSTNGREGWKRDGLRISCDYILDKSCRMCRNIVPVAVCAEKRLHKRTKINGRVWDENSPVDAECWFLDVRSHAIIMLDKTVA